MSKQGSNLNERFLKFGVLVIKLTREINKQYVYRSIADQLLRSATSCGANYEEACAAESKKDFIHKMQIVLKELRETNYWFRLVEHAEILSGKFLEMLSREVEELMKITAKSVLTAKSRK